MKPSLKSSNFPVPRKFEPFNDNLQPGSTYYRAGKLTIIVSPPYKAAAMGWHMSISHPDRYPTWDEIAFYRYRLLPDAITMVMYLPPLAEYVNVHPNCFHLHQEGNPK